MAKQTKLVDLTLVTKHFVVSNYSYPRGDGSQVRRDWSDRKASSSSAHSALCEMAAGHRELRESRESRESNSSVPSMVEDQGSDEEDGAAEDELQYHVTGAEIWDSFWMAKDSQDKVRYGRRLKDGPKPTRAQSQDLARPPSRHEHVTTDDSVAWPLADGHSWNRPRTPKSPSPAKASYSLFPRSASSHKPSMSLPPRRPSRSDTPVDIELVQAARPATRLALTVNRQKRPAPLKLSAVIPHNTQQPTPPSSVPASPALAMAPMPDSAPASERTLVKRHGRRPSLSTSPGATSKRSRSVPGRGSLGMSQANKSESHLTSIRRPRPQDIPPLPPVPHTAPLPCSPSRPSRPSTRPEVGFPPDINAYLARLPPAPTTRPTSPPRVSFWLDSDSDGASDDESRSLARRILGGLAGHKEREARDAKGHKRSASDGRKMSEAPGRAPLRRPRAGTVSQAMAERPDALIAEYKGKRDEKDKERPRNRRQGSEVLGRMLGRKGRDRNGPQT